MNDNNRKYTSLKDLSFGFSEQDGWLGGVSGDDPGGEQHTDSFASDQGNAPFSHSDVPPENDPYRSAAQDQNAYPPEMPYNAPARPSAAKNKAIQTAPAPADAKRFFYTFLVFSTVNFALPLFFKEFWVLIPYLFQIISGAAVYVISTAENKKKNLQRFLIADVIFILACAVLRMLYPQAFANISERVYMPLVMMPFMMIGAVMIVANVVLSNRKKHQCTFPVQATCVELLEKENYDHESGASTTVYCPVYEYVANGVRLRSNDAQYSNVGIPQLNERYEIMIDPEHPEIFYDPNRKFASHVITIVGTGFFTMGGAGFLMMLISVIQGL